MSYYTNILRFGICQNCLWWKFLIILYKTKRSTSLQCLVLVDFFNQLLLLTAQSVFCLQSETASGACCSRLAATAAGSWSRGAPASQPTMTFTKSLSIHILKGEFPQLCGYNFFLIIIFFPLLSQDYDQH